MSNKKKAARIVRAQLANQRRRQRTLWTSVVAVAVLVIAGLTGWAVYANQRTGAFTAPPGASADRSGIVSGSGPVTVDVYADFICPFCERFESGAGATLDKLVADGKITLVYHPVAFLDDKSSTRYSTRASAAAGCAAAGGKFRPYAEALFRRQPAEGSAGLSDDELVSIGAALGLGSHGFARCVRDGEYRTWTRHVTDDAARRGVTGTPTVYVAGKPVEPSSAAVTAAVAASAS